MQPEKDTLKKETDATTPLGTEWDNLEKTTRQAKFSLNYSKIMLGLCLLKMEQMQADYKIQENYGTIYHSLAHLHLNYRRTKKLIDNARFVLEMNVKEENYPLLDSAILEICRQRKINPESVLSEIQTLAYSDLIKTLEEM